MPTENKVLIVNNLQNDFASGGALPIPHITELIPLINQLQKEFSFVIATCDWHPPHHISFAPAHGKKVGQVVDAKGIDQILWPTHCVQNTWGAQFIVGWDCSRVQRIVQTGVDLCVDSYSCFYDNQRKRSSGLMELLKSYKVKEIYFAGIALDYCIKYSALEAALQGFQTYVVLDCCKGIGLNPYDIRASIDILKTQGIRFINQKDMHSSRKVFRTLRK